MPISRELKIKLVAELAERFASVKMAVVADFRGLSVTEIENLRARLRQAPAELRVVKNSLAKRAVQGTAFEALVDYFDGPSAVALSNAGEVESAKILQEFARQFPQYEIRAGLLDGRLLESNEIRELASAPPREVLLGRALGSMTSPVSGFVGVAAGLLRQVLYALKAIEEQKATP